MKKRNLFIITSLGAGGLENYILRFLFQYPEINIEILCKSGNGGDLETEFFNCLGRDKIHFRKIRYLNIFDYIWLYKFIKKGKYSSVCDFTGNFAGMSMLCSRFARTSSRISFYRNSRNHFPNNWYNNLYDKVLNRIVKKNSTYILSNSLAAFKYYFKNKITEKYRVIYNGVCLNSNFNVTKTTMRNQMGIPEKSFVIGHTGRLDYAKNHKTILEVANKVCNIKSNIYFVCVGKNVSSLYKNFNVNKNIILIDYRNDIADILKAFDLYYFPSLYEGQPNALIEAMISGLPFIASNIDSIIEMVPKDHLDLLINPLDIEAATNLIINLSENPYILSKYTCKEWAIIQYDPKNRFEEFKNYLAF